MIKEPITYRVPTATTDAGGGTEYTYADGDLDWAEVKSVNETYETGTGQPMQGNSKTFYVRYRASLAITDKWKIKYKGTDYKVNVIEKEGERIKIKTKALK
jgi:SPP1 family predicted phage head-tail adaptor